ncbi:hypothetical protein HYW76_01650 [Candidatus Pacearchaeota archaeon]|nr:hypothetical protein [Candidatus Pacearchaeota archaeon]
MINKIKNNKKGMSEVVIVILFVLLAIIAVYIVSQFLIPFLRGSMEKSKSCYDLSDYGKIIDIGNTCYEDNKVKLTIERGDAEYNIGGFAVTISNEAGSKRYDIIDGRVDGVKMMNLDENGEIEFLDLLALPAPGGANSYVLDFVDSDIIQVSLGIIKEDGGICEMGNYNLNPCPVV